MQDGPDFLELGICLLVLLIILATVVIFLRGVEQEIRLRFAAGKRKIDKRPGFPVDVLSERREDKSR